MQDDSELVSSVYRRLGDAIFDQPSVVAPLLEREPRERAFLALIMCTGEIDNGGFEQLMTNSTGDVIALGAAGGRELGLGRHAAILDEVVALFPAGDVPTRWDRRIDAWEELRRDGGVELDARLRALEDEWYGLADELDERLLAVARGLDA